MADVDLSAAEFKNLTVKNRVFRSNISGRFDNYDGSGNQARINWEVKFAKGGVGAIISSFVPVQIRGPHHAELRDHRHATSAFRSGARSARRCTQHDCKFILQLSHGGRQRDVPGIEYPIGLSSTDKADPLHGFECQRMTTADIKETVTAFAEGARRAREAGLDGVELHGANGYLITQFLSSAINDRKDEYGGPLENRARFVLEIVKAIRARVGTRLPPADEDQRDRAQQRAAVPEARKARQHRRRLGPGLPVAGRGRRRRDPRVDRQLVPASAQPGRQRSAGRRAGAHLRAAGLERRRTRFRNLLFFQERADRRAVPQAVARRRRAGGPDRGTRRCPTRARSSRP